MKALLRAFAVTAASCAIIVILTFTFAFIKKIWFGRAQIKKGHVAVLDVNGIILSSSSFLRELEERLENPAVKALVIRINSPGGLVAPSQEIFEALKKTDEKIPVYVSMGALSASGGYYVALGGRKIYANPGTLTASIGVIMEFVNVNKLYQWAKIERYALKAGKFKDIGSPFRAMTPEERELLDRLLSDIHQQFKFTVKERRKLGDEQLEMVTDGRIMSGHQALQTKLVDALGGSEDAIRDAKKAAGLPETAYVDYPESKTGLLRKILWGDSESIFDILSHFNTANFSSGWRVLLLAPLAFN